MSEIVPSIFVIANPEDRGEILAPLMEAGFRDILVGDGSDETVAFCERLRPDVVVLCAALDRGDARAVIAELRDSPHGDVVRIVLIGETHGPIRNALDVAELAVDRFLGQPLSPKALVFSVRTCAEAALAARIAQETDTRSGTVGGQPDDSNDSRDVHGDGDPGGMENGDQEGSWDDGEFEIEIDADEVPDGIAVTDALYRDSHDWDEPAMPSWREPTVILADEGADPPPEDMHVSPPELSVRDKPQVLAGAHFMGKGHEIWTDFSDTGGGQPSPLVENSGLTADLSAELGDKLEEEDIGGGLDEDFSEALDAEYLASASELDAHLADLDGRPEGEGEFARALRRKMSAMAERLFPGQHPARSDSSIPEVDDGPAFTARATSIPEPNEATPRGISREAPGEFIGDRPGVMPRPVIDESLDKPVVEKGTIRRGEADAIILIERMYRKRFTGRITFRCQHAVKSVSFENGKPVFASSTLPEDRLGALLYREGKITRDQHGQGYARALESGKRMAEVLVEMGYLKRREILPVVRRHLEDLVYSVFAWDSGEYEVIAGWVETGERIRIARHPAAMILEGIRRKLDLGTLMELVGTPATVLQITDDRQIRAIVSVADLSPVERRIIASFDGEHTIDQVSRGTKGPQATVYHLAYGLLIMRAAEVVRYGDGPGTGLPDDEVPIDRQRILGKLALVRESDYFALLGVRRDASAFEIQRAYEAAQRDYASEMFSLEVRHTLSAEIAEINEMLEEAYRVLRSDSLRNAYLRNLRD